MTTHPRRSSVIAAVTTTATRSLSVSTTIGHARPLTFLFPSQPMSWACVANLLHGLSAQHSDDAGSRPWRFRAHWHSVSMTHPHAPACRQRRNEPEMLRPLPTIFGHHLPLALGLMDGEYAMEDAAGVQGLPTKPTWALGGCGQQECCLSRS